MNINIVILMGNLTRDPELTYTPAGTAVCKFGLAINERWKDQNGEQQEEVHFFEVECWKRVAETTAEYMSKGSGVTIEGKLKQDRWEKDGQKRSKVKIVARYVHFMPRGEKRDRGEKREPPKPEGREEPAFDMPDEDVPF